MLSIYYVEYRKLAQCRYAECRYAEYHFTECRGATHSAPLYAKDHRVFTMKHIAFEMLGKWVDYVVT